VNKASLYLAIFSLPVVLHSAAQTSVQRHTLPSKMVQARTVYIFNGGGNEEAYREFYKDMSDWGKYRIVDSVNDADISIEFSFPWTHAIVGGSEDHSYWQAQVSVFDARTNTPVWYTDYDQKSVAWWDFNNEVRKSADHVVDFIKSCA
jgi:hypothetical protein